MPTSGFGPVAILPFGEYRPRHLPEGALLFY
jgi:hypothetical protein